MAKAKKDDHFLELAKRGASAQLNDLLHEIKLLVNMFPHLRDSVDKDELPIPFLLKRGARAGKGVADAAAGNKRVLSPTARRAISNAQKKRWALHRANAAKKS